ncbi:MAG: ATP-binding cassette domain-containing protein, partial [Proteobacteria bacterium]|nr:ATP-binding cassette domain-containing protein [Pseudomonadota bacterium]
NDFVTIDGNRRHVIGYLQDFLFEPERARLPVKFLSGGERNRLLLARLFAQPANVLVLDEPTNDLDMDMLDVLEDILDNFDGTVLLVSHDRDFLDRMVTSVISFDPDGQVREYPGGYSDMLRQRKAVPSGNLNPRQTGSKHGSENNGQPANPGKMTYKDKRALDPLPTEIQKLERDATRIEAELADPKTYAKDPESIPRLAKLLETARQLISEKQDRWLELEMMREELEGAD